ncbi:MAG: phosphoserine phosphatase SerB [Phyllobacteriaceae bacterium]|nr:phosphoserine phosphatase SerB [Phyllobacteriaceae bacterium]
MSQVTGLIATLITNPQTPLITADIARAAAHALGAKGHEWLATDIAVDIPLPDEMPAVEADALLRKLLAGLPIDIAIQNRATRRKAMLIADMDSTMIEQECIDELAAMAGLKDRVSAITARAMNGEIAFEPALRERVALLAGLPFSIIETVLAERISYTPGGKALVATMRAHGAFTALVSGGFTAFTAPVAAALGFDANRANTLHQVGGVLAGTVAEPILGRQAKVDALDEFAAQRGISPTDVLAIGDGANDLGMLHRAGTGVALHAKPSVAAEAKIRIDHGDLTALLYVQGYHQSEFAGTDGR